MRIHHLLALGLAFGLAPAGARADKPASPPGKGPDAKPGAGDHAPGKPERTDARDSDKGAKREHPDKGEPDEPRGRDGERGAKPEGPGGGDYKRAWKQLHDELKTGKIKKDELKAKLDKMQETSPERAKEHRRELAQRWGNSLGTPAAREELKHHARRVAFLNRAMVLAESEPKDQQKRTERITKLLDTENERHERAMARLASTPAAPVLSASAAAAAAPPPSASAETAKGVAP